MWLFRAASVGVVPGSGAHSQMDSLRACGKLRPPRVIAQNEMLLNSFVSGVTFQRNASNLAIGGCDGPVSRQANVAGDLREGADVGEDSS
jgi:hypothetical protein